MADPTEAQKQLGAATAILGGGTVLTALGVVFENGMSTAFSLLGVFLIVIGAIRMGMASKLLKEESSS